MPRSPESSSIAKFALANSPTKVHTDIERTVAPSTQVAMEGCDAHDVRSATTCPVCPSLDLGVASSAAQQLLTSVVDDPESARLQPPCQEGSGVAPGHKPPWRRIFIKICVTVIIFLVVMASLEKFAQKPMERISHQLMHRIGLPGLFVAVLLFDFLPQPFTYIPLILMAVEGSVTKSRVFLVCAAASYSAAILGYFVGNCLRRRQRGRDWFNRASRDYPYLPDLMEKRGAVGVLIAAMLPMPLALATWTAGFFGVNFVQFLVAAVGRFPKIILFVVISGKPGFVNR